jgi:hypothetical protein
MLFLRSVLSLIPPLHCHCHCYCTTQPAQHSTAERMKLETWNDFLEHFQGGSNRKIPYALVADAFIASFQCLQGTVR